MVKALNSSCVSEQQTLMIIVYMCNLFSSASSDIKAIHLHKSFPQRKAGSFFQTQNEQRE